MARSYRLSTLALLVTLAFLLAGKPVLAAQLRDLLEPDRLAKHVKATDVQKTILSAQLGEIRKIISDYQWTRGKATCEAILWRGESPDIKQLGDTRKETLKSVLVLLDTLKAGLKIKQAEKIDKLLKSKENILDFSIADHPFYTIRNTPLFPRMMGRNETYKISLPGAPNPENQWSYSTLLKVWSVRNFIPDQRPINDTSGPNIADQPGYSTRIDPARPQLKAIKSSLFLAATLFVPDLAKEEFNLLQKHYDQDKGKLKEKETWEEFVKQNQINDRILIRLKMNTPFAGTYLNADRWIIFLEDSDGVGYEPVETYQEAFRPVEALEVSVPGRSIDIVDVYGNSYPYIPGYQESYLLEAPTRVTYTGNEKLVKLFFSLRDHHGNTIIDEDTKFVKLVVQSEETSYGRAELVWELKRARSKFHPRDEL